VDRLDPAPSHHERGSSGFHIAYQVSILWQVAAEFVIAEAASADLAR
jgi:hypothetical protein